MPTTEIQKLELQAALCRQNVLRMCRAHNAGHLGGAFSCMDIVTALYFHTMRHSPDRPNDPDRDRLILSAGHKALAQYAALGEYGYFDKALFDTYGCLHCRMPGHPDMHKLPGIEANTGALGHGLSIGCGMALGLRRRASDARVFVVMGDGELAEGSNWEGAAVAAHYRLDHLTLIVDNNGLQIGGKVTDLMNFSPIAEHFRGFGWAVREIDGNDMAQVVEALDALPYAEGKPSVIVAKSIKSKGYSRAENVAKYHFWTPAPGELDEAEAEIKKRIEEMQ